MRSATSSIPASRRSPLVAPSRLPKSSQVAQKGPDARRRGRRHPEAYSLYVERVPPPAPTKQMGLFQQPALLETHVLVGGEGRHRHQVDGVLGHARPDAGQGAEIHERCEHRTVDGQLLDAMEDYLALGRSPLPSLL